MSDIDRPERITNITGLRAQPESPEADAGGPAGRRRWPWARCRLCQRPVWMFARACVCGMTDPARDERRRWVAPAAAAVAAVAGVTVAWLWLGR